MPQIKLVPKLKEICLNNIYSNLPSYWRTNSIQIEQLLEGPKLPLYYIGPFESLDDQTIEHLLKKLYYNNQLSKSFLLLLIHNRIRKLDFSFIKKKGFFSSAICHNLGNNCYNLVELNLFAQVDLTSKNLIDILHSMHELKKLNLSHTQTNQPVTRLISRVCRKLEHLSLDNCKKLYDDCIEEITDQLFSTIQYLSVDNVSMSAESVERILLKCRQLKYFQADHLNKIIERLYQKSVGYDEDGQQDLQSFKLETILIDSSIVLKPSIVEAITFTCPKLRMFTINCIGSNSCLDYLEQFPYLTELLIANPTMISFKFDGGLLKALRNSFGKQLKSLTLLNVTDVNLRSIAKYCVNLVKLRVEFISSYQPAKDEPRFNDSDNNQDQVESIKSLRFLAISNFNTKTDQVQLNVGQFRKDLTLLLSNGCVRSLELNSLNELDDEYFQHLFSLPVKNMTIHNVTNSVNNRISHVHDSIETLNFTRMNSITSDLVLTYLISNENNALRSLSLNACKMISRGEAAFLKKFIQRKRFDCDLIWS